MWRVNLSLNAELYKLIISLFKEERKVWAGVAEMGS